MRPPTNVRVTPAQCPICRKRFDRGTVGWDRHVNGREHRQDWRPEIQDDRQRLELFSSEFPDFFGAARTPSRRAAPTSGDPARTRKLTGVLGQGRPGAAQSSMPPSATVERVNGAASGPAMGRALEAPDPGPTSAKRPTVPVPGPLVQPLMVSCPYCHGAGVVPTVPARPGDR